MKIAVLSDVHSNHFALEACLAEAEARGAEQYLFLGDYLSDCAYPEKTMAALYAWEKNHDCRFLRGNREEYLLSHRAGGEQHWGPGSESGSLYYTYQNLTEQDLDWISALPNRMTVELPGWPTLLCCHGSPQKTNGVIRPNVPETWDVLQDVSEEIVLHGHHHQQWDFFANGKRVINAGSVGVNKGTARRACFLMLSCENGKVQVEHLQIPYNVQGAVDELYSSGLAEIAPVWAAAIRKFLLTGENIAPKVLQRAHELHKLDTGEDGFAEEKYWRQAAQEIGLRPISAKFPCGKLLQ